MALVVTKFGGRSLATVDHVKKIAGYLAQRVRNDKMVVVVSAMGSQTDELMGLARSINPEPKGRELDMLLTAGERITMSLLAMSLEKRGVRARSFTGSQVGIHTDESHNDALILFVRGSRLRETLEAGETPIVAGFQGVSAEAKEVTTLGRGGSDTTAVALAHFLNADRCEFYKTVKGLCSADPRLVPGALCLSRISYPEIVELADYGAKVLHPRAAALAMRYRIPLEIRSSMKPRRAGTIVGDLEEIEERFVRALTQMKDLVRFTVKDVPRDPCAATQAVGRLANAGVRILFYSHGHPSEDTFDLVFIVTAQDAPQARKILEAFCKKTRAEDLSEIKNISEISLVGPGAGRDAEITRRAFNTLRSQDVHIEAFTTSELKLTFFLRTKSLKRTIAKLLEEFNLMERSK